MEDSMSSLSAALPDLIASRQCFPFFRLPYELRSKILLYVIKIPRIIDLDPINYRAAHQRLHLFLTCKRLHHETSCLFYGSHTFRIFPTHGRFFAPKTIPLLARLPTHYREDINSLELRLGPGWNSPPKSWWVDSRLGLEEMKNMRTLHVFVELDPSHDVFKGFRLGKNFFTDFAAHLLEEIVRRLPNLVQITFDAWPSVMREGPLMKRLVEVAKKGSTRIIEIRLQQPCDQKMIAGVPLVESSRSNYDIHHP